jgi:hypothetical protein
VNKQPRDHIRLLRAFDVPPTKYGAAAWSTGIFSLFALSHPILFVPVGATVAGIGGFSVSDRIAIAKRLREVEVFGFPVAGYREWLLAEVPTFDIELKRDVDIEVIRTSTTAVDASITVEKKSERVFRFVMRRIALPNTKPHLPPIEVGDRRLLQELHRRILAPLQADVGIVTMRMGDKDLVAQPAQHASDEPASTSTLNLGAFRESAMAAPPALQALVQVGGERALPHEARGLKLRSERVMHAASASPSGAGSVAAIMVGGLFSGVQFGPTGAWVGLTGGLIGGIAAVVTGNRRNAKSVARAVANQGYPIEDYDDWLLSGRPLFDIETTRPIPRDWFLTRMANLTAWSVTKNAMVPWVEDVAWLSDTQVRLETRPSYIQPPGSRIEPFYGGSHEMFRRFMHEVLALVHAQSEIRAVRMGGYIDRRV